MAKSLPLQSKVGNLLVVFLISLVLISLGVHLFKNPKSLPIGSLMYNAIYGFWHPWHMKLPKEDSPRLTSRHIRVYALAMIISGCLMILGGIILLLVVP